MEMSWKHKHGKEVSPLPSTFLAQTAEADKNAQLINNTWTCPNTMHQSISWRHLHFLVIQPNQSILRQKYLSLSYQLCCGPDKFKHLHSLNHGLIPSTTCNTQRAALHQAPKMVTHMYKGQSKSLCYTWFIIQSSLMEATRV